jgi:phosphoribosylanthranilate isomerase
VGVFGDQSEALLLTQAAEIDVDVLQLHGTRDAEAVHRLRVASGRQVWPVVRVGGDALPVEAEALARAAGLLVLDAMVVGQLGGTGVALDWSGLAASVATLRARVPGVQLVLAGGLRPDNVATAIRLLRPDVVDVSSGVERAPGVKDPERVQQFVQAVRSTAESP